MSIEIGNVRSEPGTKKSGGVKILTMADGGDLTLPIHIVTGTEPGPKLCLTAALHGDETNSISAVMEIVKKTNVDDLSGTIIALPVANPLAFEAGTYHTPMDGMNMEFHCFPGKENGLITERIAYSISHEIVTKENVDVLVEVHGTPLSFNVELNYLYISPGLGEIGRQNEELSMLEDYEVLYRGDPQRWPGSLVGYATEQGIPNCYSAGKARDIPNIMKHLGMIPGEPILPKRQFITRYPRAELRPTHGGMLYPEFFLEDYPDQIVPKDTLLARVISPYTFKELEQIVAPFEAAVFLWVPRPCKVNPGDYAYILGNMEGVEWIRR